MGDSYRPPVGEAPRREPHQLEAMERAYHARVNFKTLERLMREGESTFYDSQDEFEMQFGNSAQSALEHALKGLIASCRQEFNRTHALDALKEHAESLVPEFGGLQSPLAVLSAFAGGDIYGTPDLEMDITLLYELLESDMVYLFDLIREQGDFDPWVVRKSDFRF